MEKPQRDKIIGLLHEDWPIPAIAAEVGVPEATVRQTLAEAGYTPEMAAAARQRLKEATARAQGRG